MGFYKTHLEKLPSTILQEAKELLNCKKHHLEVKTPHLVTMEFSDNNSIFQTSANFNSSGSLINYHCSCKKPGLCKHVAALLTYLNSDEEAPKEILDKDEAKMYLRRYTSLPLSSYEAYKLLKHFYFGYSEESVNNFLCDYCNSSEPNNIQLLLSILLYARTTSISESLVNFVKNFIIKFIHINSNNNLIFETKRNTQVFSLCKDYFERGIDSMIATDIYIDALLEGLTFSPFIHEYFIGCLNGLNTKYLIKDLEKLYILIDKLDYLEDFYKVNVFQVLYISLIVNKGDVEHLEKLINHSHKFFNNVFGALLRIFELLESKNIDQKYKDVFFNKLIELDINELLIFLRESKTNLSNFDYYYSLISSKLSPFTNYTLNKDLNSEMECVDCTIDLTLRQAIDLMLVGYPFKQHKNFFDNKELIVDEIKDLEIFEEETYTILEFLSIFKGQKCFDKLKNKIFISDFETYLINKLKEDILVNASALEFLEYFGYIKVH